MSNKNKKKAKRKMSPETKDKLKTGFGTLISNDACIKAGRNYHSWVAILLAVCSVVVALIPSFVARMTVKAGTTLLSTSYGLDNGLAHFAEDMQVNDAHITIEDGKVTAANWDKMCTSTTAKWYQVRSTTDNSLQLEVFFNDTVNISDADYMTYVTNGQDPYTLKNRLETTYVDSQSSTVISSRESDDRNIDATSYALNVVVFGKSYFRVATFSKASTTAAYNVNFQYDKCNGFDLAKFATQDSHGNAYSKTYAEDPSGYVASVRAAWVGFLNDAYQSTKIISAWSYTGIMAAIYAGLILILSLVIFLVTRGKRNPYRIYTFWQTQKMGYWAAPACAILSLFGFFLQNYAFFIFIFVYGLRIMWMSMKSLSPTQSK